MYDINFFSVYKKKKGKSNGLKIFIIVLLAIFVLGNALLIGAYLISTAALDTSIQGLKAKINSPDTQAKIAEAARIKQEAALTNEYLNLLKSASAKLDQIDYIDTALLDKIRNLTPSATYFTAANCYENMIKLDCQSNLATEPMDMYHAFLNDKTFVNVTISSIKMDSAGNSTFSISCQIAGGDIQ